MAIFPVPARPQEVGLFSQRKFTEHRLCAKHCPSQGLGTASAQPRSGNSLEGGDQEAAGGHSVWLEWAIERTGSQAGSRA